eukprot:m.263988 g.263988  ORF g.263988 m.263988 type:complete len:279 (+) comp40462_c1_seq8:347-1183(+)
MAWNHFKMAAKLPNRTVKLGYVSLVAREAELNKAHLIAAMIYTNRIQKRSPAFLETISSSDLFLISLLVAGKFLYDEGEDESIENSEWACIGKRRKSAINVLERKYLAALDWDTFISPLEYKGFSCTLDAQTSMHSALMIGWFSYSHLNSILQWLEEKDFKEEICWQLAQILAGCCLVYLTVFYGMVGLGHATGPHLGMLILNQSVQCARGHGHENDSLGLHQNRLESMAMTGCPRLDAHYMSSALELFHYQRTACTSIAILSAKTLVRSNDLWGKHS